MDLIIDNQTVSSFAFSTMIVSVRLMMNCVLSKNSFFLSRKEILDQRREFFLTEIDFFPLKTNDFI